jgi:hypothetical protein
VANNEPTLRPYEPSWRDRLATFLMGDARPSPERRRFVEGLTGSSGLGSIGMGLADFVPGLGNVLAGNEAKRAYDEGDWIGAGLGAAGAMPMPLPAGRATKTAADLNSELKALLADIAANPLPETAAQRAAKRAPTIDPSRLPPPPRVTMDPARAARAADLGFDLDRELYHGTRSVFPSFSLENADPHAGERAIFLTDHPQIAESYAKLSGRPNAAGELPNIIPLVSRAQNPLSLDLDEVVRSLRAGPPGLDGPNMFHRAVAEAISRGRAGGHDMIELRNMLDLGSLGERQTQYVVTDPSILRSRFAQFDPARKGENDLLASITGLGALGAGGAGLAAFGGASDAQADEAPMFRLEPVAHDPFAMGNETYER